VESWARIAQPVKQTVRDIHGAVEIDQWLYKQTTAGKREHAEKGSGCMTDVGLIILGGQFQRQVDTSNGFERV